MIEAAPHISEMTPAQRRKARIAGVIGNVVEWYDFVLYGYFDVIIGRLFSRLKIRLRRFLPAMASL